MKFMMTVEMDNAAFEDNPSELSDILGKVGDRILVGQFGRPGDSGKVLDTNGNTVGEWRISDDC